MNNEIISFLEENIGVSVENMDVDIHLDLGVDGDDFSELIEKYAMTYEIDMTTYKWYFHHDEEGFNIGRIFIKHPISA